MADKLKLVKGSPSKLALVYGMRLVDAGQVKEINDASIKTTTDETKRITMHLIEGTKEQIKAQLLQSIDAFFELVDEANFPKDG